MNGRPQRPRTDGTRSRPGGPRDEIGMSLIEALIAIVLVGIALAGISQAFVTQMDANTRNDKRSGAIAAAQQVMEALRRQDPAGMPTTGSSSPQQVSMGGRDYQVVTSYCLVPSYCGTVSRHLRIEVTLDGQDLYSVESVYTQLR